MADERLSQEKQESKKEIRSNRTGGDGRREREKGIILERKGGGVEGKVRKNEKERDYVGGEIEQHQRESQGANKVKKAEGNEDTGVETMVKGKQK